MNPPTKLLERLTLLVAMFWTVAIISSVCGSLPSQQAAAETEINTVATESSTAAVQPVTPEKVPAETLADLRPDRHGFAPDRVVKDAPVEAPAPAPVAPASSPDPDHAAPPTTSVPTPSPPATTPPQRMTAAQIVAHCRPTLPINPPVSFRPAVRDLHFSGEHSDSGGIVLDDDIVDFFYATDRHGPETAVCYIVAHEFMHAWQSHVFGSSHAALRAFGDQLAKERNADCLTSLVMPAAPLSYGCDDSETARRVLNGEPVGQVEPPKPPAREPDCSRHDEENGPRIAGCQGI